MWKRNNYTNSPHSTVIWVILVNIITHLPPLKFRCWLFRGSDSQIGKETKNMGRVHYWRSHVHEWPSILRALARVMFGAPASASVMDAIFASLTCLSLASAADWPHQRKRWSFTYEASSTTSPKTFQSLATKRRRTPFRIRLKTCMCKGSTRTKRPESHFEYQLVCLRKFAIHCCFTKYGMMLIMLTCFLAGRVSEFPCSPLIHLIICHRWCQVLFTVIA